MSIFHRMNNKINDEKYQFKNIFQKKFDFPCLIKLPILYGDN